MKKLFFLFIIIFAIPSCSTDIKCDSKKPENCVKVLFIGNSYTYENNLPFVLSKLANSGGKILETGISANGGWTLSEHVNDQKTNKLIQENDWTYIVIQEQSEIPAIEGSRYASMYPAVRELVVKIKQNHSIPLLFETWAHKDGMKEYGINDYHTMQYDIIVGYEKIATELFITISPVGRAWMLVHEKYPNIELWQSDGSHPNKNGTYLAACVFYAVIYLKSPVGLSYIYQIPMETASVLQEIANEVVFGV